MRACNSFRANTSSNASRMRGAVTMPLESDCSLTASTSNPRLPPDLGRKENQLHRTPPNRHEQNTRDHTSLGCFACARHFPWTAQCPLAAQCRVPCCSICRLSRRRPQLLCQKQYPAMALSLEAQPSSSGALLWHLPVKLNLENERRRRTSERKNEQENVNVKKRKQAKTQIAFAFRRNVAYAGIHAKNRHQ